MNQQQLQKHQHKLGKTCCLLVIIIGLSIGVYYMIDNALHELYMNIYHSIINSEVNTIENVGHSTALIYFGMFIMMFLFNIDNQQKINKVDEKINKLQNKIIQSLTQLNTVISSYRQNNRMSFPNIVEGQLVGSVNNV